MPAADLAIFIPSLAGGGAERVMVTLSQEFADRGYRVDLVLAVREGPFLCDVSDRVRVLELRKRNVSLWPIALARYLRRTRVPVLLSAMTHSNVAAVLARSLALSSTRVIVSERAAIGRVLVESPRPLVRLLPTLMRLTYPRADGVIAVSNGVADDLAQVVGLPRGDVHVIYNPVVTDQLRSQRDEPLEHPWFAPGEPPVIVTAGRLATAKDHACLLTAFARLRRDRECRLAILGEGPLRTRLHAYCDELGISGDVEMPGFQTNPFNWMRQADVFVLSSRREGLPNTLIQAMACGTPVVSTDCPSGPAEILENGKWGRLVPVGDAAALAAAIAATLDESCHPDVEKRAADFGIDAAVEGYARALGLSS